MNAKAATYLAGFFDGEGCFCIVKNGSYFQLKAFVTLTDLGLLEWCRQATGLGHIYKLESGAAHHAQQWQWHCAGEETKCLASNLLPYLKLKQEHAQLALDFPIISHKGKPVKRPLSRLGQVVARERMQELNKKEPRGSSEVVPVAELEGMDGRED